MRSDKYAVLKRILVSARPIAWGLAIGAVLNILSVLAAVAAPEILGELVQILCDAQNGFVGLLLPGLALLLGIYAIQSGLSYGNMRLMNQVVSRYYTCELRIQLSDKIRRLPVRYVDQTPVGDILRRMTDDVSEMGGYVHQIFDILIQGVFQLTLIGVMMFLEDWRLACFVILLTPASMLLSTKIAGISEKHYDSMFAHSGKITEVVEEAFSNFPTTKAYNLEQHLQTTHAAVNADLRTASIKANFTGSMVQPLIRLSNALCYIFICLLGGWLIVERGVSIGAVVTIILYARLFANPLEQLAYGFSQINRVKAAAKRVFDILDMEEETDPPSRELSACRGSVRFEAVDFSYRPEEPLIQGLNLSVQPGQKIAIVGPTGAGKTTIVNLLMRFYDPNSGKIYLDDLDISGLPRETVREAFGMVLQDTWLFRGTIWENLAFGNPKASREEILSACRATHCHDFIQMLPQGYDTVIGEDTTNLSGGQKQLLTIARAFLANRPLLILDEATSNVDTRTEVLIQQAMDRLMEGKTCFVIAHRLSTIVDADNILVLDHGKIVEQGTHKQLLNARGFYYQMFQSQYAI